MKKHVTIRRFCFCVAAAMLFGIVSVTVGQDSAIKKQPSTKTGEQPNCTLPPKKPIPDFSGDDSLNLDEVAFILETTDSDCDGISDHDDNCRQVYNPRQTDRNRNKVGDVCEPKKRVPNPISVQSTRKPPCTMPAEVLNTNTSRNEIKQLGMTPDQARYLAKTSDDDCDRISNADDNCPSDYNPRQTDRNKNGFGDVCEPSRRVRKGS